MGNRIDIPHETVNALRTIGRERLIASIEGAAPGPDMKVFNTSQPADDIKRLLTGVVTELLDQTAPDVQMLAGNWAEKLQFLADKGESASHCQTAALATFLAEVARGSDQTARMWVNRIKDLHADGMHLCQDEEKELAAFLGRLAGTGDDE
jgi:hypothetical protein